MIQPVLGILVVRHLDGARVSTREGFDWDPSQQESVFHPSSAERRNKGRI